MSAYLATDIWVGRYTAVLKSSKYIPNNNEVLLTQKANRIFRS